MNGGRAESLRKVVESASETYIFVLAATKRASHGTVGIVPGVPIVQGGSYWHCQGVAKENECRACRKLKKGH